jgi:hypothetical protein
MTTSDVGDKRCDGEYVRVNAVSWRATATSAVALSVVCALSAYAYVTTNGTGTSIVGTTASEPQLVLSVPSGQLTVLIASAPNGSISLPVTGTNNSNATLTLGSAPSARLSWDTNVCPAGSFTADTDWGGPESVRAHRSKQLDTTVIVTFQSLGVEQAGCLDVPITVIF